MAFFQKINIANISVFLILILTVSLLCENIYSAEDSIPSLPSGLEAGSDKTKSNDSLPALPKGLGSSDNMPALPSGLGIENSTSKAGGRQGQDQKSLREKLPFDLTGFWEVRYGVRTQSDQYEKNESLNESRLQLQLDKSWNKISLRLTGDLVYDAIPDNNEIDFETGQGWVDLRDAYVFLRPVSFMDIKLGRQILTWGTGDMLFINDLFPKDWNSFFIGRDEEYLKAPSDAAKASFFNRLANLDVVYVPEFDADRFIDGSRISYYNSVLISRAGRNAVSNPIYPHDLISENELSARLYKNIGGYEFAAYLYDGYWKSPGGMDALTSRPTFPKLNVYGASVRGQFGKGIANMEFGYYDSNTDIDGKNPLINNNQVRFLAGYEQEVAKDFTAGLQYYCEYMVHHDQYQSNLPSMSPESDRNRQVVTLRLTKLLMDQNLKLSLFTYYSPTDKDMYFRPNINYKVNDYWTAEVGGNIFWGAEKYTFFSQFEKNSNVFASLRYGF